MVAHFLGVLVLGPGYGVPAPADHRPRRQVGAQNACMFEDVKYRIRNPGRAGEVEKIAVRYVRADVDDVPQHRKKVLPHPLDHPAIDEGGSGRVLDD